MPDINSKTYSPQQSYKPNHINIDDVPEYDPNTDPSNPYAKGKIASLDLAGQAGLAIRAGIKGIAGIADTAAGYANMALNNVIPHEGDLEKDYQAPSAFEGFGISPVVDKVNTLADEAGLPRPRTPNEKLLDSSVSNAAAYAIPIGGELKLSHALINAGAGGLAGLAQETAAQHDANGLTQDTTNLVVGLSGLVIGHKLLGVFGPDVTKVVKDNKLEDIFDKNGNLTDRGQDVLAKHNVSEDSVRQAYHMALANTEQHYSNWFKGSKIVGEDGAPLTVYHGTSEDITGFDPATKGKSTGAPSAKLGYFFTDDPKVADIYSKRKTGENGLPSEEDYASSIPSDNSNYSYVEGSNIVPAHLSIKNPYVYDFQGTKQRPRSFSDIIQEAKDLGHDGVVFKNTYDLPKQFHEQIPNTHNVYIAFDPAQIKSKFVDPLKTLAESGKLHDDFVERPKDLTPDETEQLVKDYHAGSDPTPIEQYESPHINDQRTIDQRAEDSQSLNKEFLGEDKPLITKGEASQNRFTINNERNLPKSHLPAGNDAAKYYNDRQASINSIGHELRNALGKTNETEKAIAIRNALVKLKESSYSSVKDLFTQLHGIAKAPKVDAINFINDAKSIKFPTGDKRRIDLLNTMAEYNLIPPEWIESTSHDPIFKTTKVNLKNGKALEFNGKPKTLTLANTDKLNADLNVMYRKGELNPHLTLKTALYKDFINTLDGLAAEHPNKVVGDLASKSKIDYQEHLKSFTGKDNIIAKILNQDEQGNYHINDDKVMDIILGPKNEITNLKKLKGALMSNHNTKELWSIISAHALDKFLGDSMKGENFSGSILGRLLKTTGEDKLKILFDPHEYNNIMKLKRLADDAVATGIGTNAPFKNHLMNMIYHTARFSSLFLGHGASHVAALLSFGLSDLGASAKIARDAESTLAGMKDYKANPTKEKLFKPELSMDKLKNLLNVTIASNKIIRPLVQGTLSHKDNQ